MFERFTDRARRVVVLAQEESRRLGHNYIGTEHLLLGIAIQEDGVAAQVLASRGVTRERIRAGVEELVEPGGGAPMGHIPFTPRAKKVLELSLREAMQLNHNYIGTEHILLGLVREGEGVGAQALRSFGLDLSELRQRVIALIPQEPRGESAGAAVYASASSKVSLAFSERNTEDDPRCSMCGAALGETLRWRTVAAQAAGDGDSRDVVIAFCGQCGRAIGPFTAP